MRNNYLNSSCYTARVHVVGQTHTHWWKPGLLFGVSGLSVVIWDHFTHSSIIHTQLLLRYHLTNTLLCAPVPQNVPRVTNVDKQILTCMVITQIRTRPRPPQQNIWLLFKIYNNSLHWNVYYFIQYYTVMFSKAFCID